LVDPPVHGIALEAEGEADVRARPAQERWLSATAPGVRFVRRCMVFYLALFASLWIVAIVVTYAKLHRQGKPFGVNALMFDNGNWRFDDFAAFDPVKERFTLGGTSGLLVYPAPMVSVYVAFTRHFQKPLHKYLLFIGSLFSISGAGLALILYRSSANRWLLATAAIVTVAAGYPFLFLIERSNMEGVIFSINAAALTAFIMRRHLLAGAMIAVATSMKIFPGLLFALLLARKRYRELAWSVALILPLELISLWIVGPSISIAYANVKIGLANVTNKYFLGYQPPVMGYDHSLFSVVKQVLHLKLRNEALHSQILALGPWYSILVAIGLLALYWLRIRKLPLLNQAMVLMVLAVTLPYISFEYTLTGIYLVWAMFVLHLSRDVTEGKEQIHLSAAVSILGLMAFLFVPVYYISGGTQIYGGQVKTLALLALTGILLALPMRSTVFDSA
jgi:hypothetical protein